MIESIILCLYYLSVNICCLGKKTSLKIYTLLMAIPVAIAGLFVLGAGSQIGQGGMSGLPLFLTVSLGLVPTSFIFMTGVLLKILLNNPSSGRDLVKKLFVAVILTLAVLLPLSMTSKGFDLLRGLNMISSYFILIFIPLAASLIALIIAIPLKFWIDKVSKNDSAASTIE